MNTYAIKLITGENLAYRTLEEVLDVIAKVREARTRQLPNVLIELNHLEGNTTCYVFPDMIMGYAVISGELLDSIVAHEEALPEQKLTFYQEMEAIAEMNLTPTDATVD